MLGHLDGRRNGGVRGLADRLASVEGRLHDTVAIDGPSLASPSRRMMVRSPPTDCATPGSYKSKRRPYS